MTLGYLWLYNLRGGDFFLPLLESSKNQVTSYTYLVGGFNPSEEYARQNGNLPQIGVKINNIWNHHLVTYHYSIWTSKLMAKFKEEFVCHGLSGLKFHKVFQTKTWRHWHQLAASDFVMKHCHGAPKWQEPCQWRLNVSIGRVAWLVYEVTQCGCDKSSSSLRTRWAYTSWFPPPKLRCSWKVVKLQITPCSVRHKKLETPQKLNLHNFFGSSIQNLQTCQQPSNIIETIGDFFE